MKKRTVFVLCLAVVCVVTRFGGQFGTDEVTAQGAGIQNGDVNGDGSRNIADAVFILNWLFVNGAPPVACATGTGLTAEEIADLRTLLTHVDVNAATSRIALNPNTTGRVGIGTTSTSSGKVLLRQSEDDETGGLSILNSTNFRTFRFFVDGNDVSHIRGGGTSNGALALNADGPGRLGIGTTGTNAGRVQIRQSDDDQSGGLAILNSTNFRSLRLFVDDGNVSHVRSGGTSNGTLALNADGAGRVGVGTSSPSSMLEVAGTVTTEVLAIEGGADLAENFDVSGDGISVEPGVVVSIDPLRPGRLVVSDMEYDRKVAGIVSGAGGVQPGMIMGQAGSIADGDYPVALTGRVYVKADASYGAIAPGDLLTSSDTPGHARKVNDYDRARGATLGKAMTALPSGRGLVLVLVSLQ